MIDRIQKLIISCFRLYSFQCAIPDMNTRFSRGALPKRVLQLQALFERCHTYFSDDYFEKMYIINTLL